ncbi:MAG: WecB/TagA/CpsF family glycosyltransferase [Patescibacteria group bacterium]
MKKKILDIPIHNTSLNSFVNEIIGWLDKDDKKQVVTVNPEIVMLAQNNDRMKNILQSTINIPDGSGLMFAARYLGFSLKERVPGVDLTEKLLLSLRGAEQSVYLLGAKHGVADRVAGKYIRKNKELNIVGAESGYRWWWQLPDKEIVNRINRTKPRLLLVAYGAPKQEVWLDQYLKKMPSVKVAIGVGGTFDYLSGSVKRAPRLMRYLYLEWLWRLWMQPWRWPRIITATWRFSWAVIRYRKKV